MQMSHPDGKSPLPPLEVLQTTATATATFAMG